MLPGPDGSHLQSYNVQLQSTMGIIYTSSSSYQLYVGLWAIAYYGGWERRLINQLSSLFIFKSNYRSPFKIAELLEVLKKNFINLNWKTKINDINVKNTSVNCNLHKPNLIKSVNFNHENPPNDIKPVQ